MNYDSYHFLGMHLFWWIFWGIVTFWIFALPFAIPGQRKRNFTPLEILQKRFAAGQITKQQFEEDRESLAKGK